MKIGFVIDDTIDKVDGVQQYTLTLGKWLTAKGHEVHYLVGESYRTDIPHIHSLSRNVKVRFNQNHLSIPLPVSKKVIRKLLRRERFDVLHVQMPYSPFLAARVVRAAGKQTAVIGTFHILPFSTIERIGTNLLGIYLRRNLRRFNATLAVSEAAAEFARNSFGINPQMLPNVIDVAAFRSVSMQYSAPEQFTIAFLGRLVPRKGAMQLLKAVYLLSGTIKQNLVVRLSGKGPLKTSLEEYVKSHGLEKIVRFDGFVSESDKPGFLGNANIAIFPSLGGESFGIVLIEAMASNSGVVMGGDNPGYRSVLGAWPETLVNAHDSKVLAGQLNAMITDSASRKRIHKQQQAAVSKYDVGSVGVALLQIYTQALPNDLEVR